VTYLEAAALGVIQGLTEFLPVSSSGHLVIVQSWLGFEDPQLFFDIAVHVGTLAAVLVVYRNDLLGMGTAIVRLAARRQSDSDRDSLILLKWVLVSTVPAAIAGILAGDFFESLFASPLAASLFLIVTGAILISSRWALREQTTVGRMTPLQALGVGLAQAFAILPGISRSGATIVCGLWMGLKRDLAVRYSFLLAIPAVLGAALLSLPDAFANGVQMAILGPVFCGGLIAGVTGFFAIRWLIRLVSRGRLYPFAYYCWGFAAVALVVHFLQP